MTHACLLVFLVSGLSFGFVCHSVLFLWFLTFFRLPLVYDIVFDFSDLDY